MMINILGYFAFAIGSIIGLLMILGHLLNKQNLPDSQVDAILVFGTGLNWKAKARWSHAAKLFKAGLARYIIVSGGVIVPDHSKTEAEWFRDNLILSGVPEEFILIESQATNAAQNASYALPILQQQNFRSVILVLSDFTGLRAHLTAKRAWQGTSIEIYNSHASSGSHWNPWTWWFKRESRLLTNYVVARLFRYKLLRYW